MTTKTAAKSDLNNISLRLEDALKKTLAPLSGLSCSVMFSGGFDSMLMACLARRSQARVTAVTVAFDDLNPLTVRSAIEGAQTLGFKHQLLHVNVVEFLSAFEALAGLTEAPVLDLDLAVVYAALKKYDPKESGNFFISGMGSDQWFGDAGLQANVVDVKARVDEMMTSQAAHHRVAEACGCKIVFPFLSRPMLALSQQIPVEMKKDKKLLRQLKIAEGIPHRNPVIEQQVPSLIRNIVIKTYGHRALPSPVYFQDKQTAGEDTLLRQIVQGLWMEKRKVSLHGQL